MKHVYFGERPLGFFVGSIGGGDCGARIVWKPSGIHFYRLQLFVGSGSNIKEDYFGLLGLLKFLLMSYWRINGGGIFQCCIGMVCWKVTIEFSKHTTLDEQDHISQAYFLLVKVISCSYKILCQRKI
jgi:hypothetical protein